jgi:hypothetical protein
VLASFNQLGWEIIEGSAESSALVTRGVNAPTKVADLQLAVDAEKVVRFVVLWMTCFEWR